ncbi:unnamed protein product [Adineta steineri]|uniref:G-protein coupled receptors family 1 profile domain-containing protein n=1 Tax=Adineta steineri TaxID=433720 RepID=A0A814NBH0_9BILA|nr:unnamed protein product [Adineta steineri]
MSLVDLGQQLTLYVTYFVLIIGIIGNGINITIFLTKPTYRTTPCTFYFLIGSITNFIYIIINFPSRIVIGYGFDLTRTSVSWCKARQCLVSTLSLITLTCSCLATIDQFLVTSQSVNLRRRSNIKWAHRIVLIIIIIWCLHGIPIVLFRNISPISKTCTFTNVVYATYIPIYYIVILSGTPVLIMTLFGCLTYRNIRETRILAQQQADRQMVKMTLVQVILVVICITPYGIDNAYGLITSNAQKDATQLMNENFVVTVVTLLSSFYCSGSCYMFLISSSSFRRAVKDRIFWWRRANRINPFQAATVGRAS